MDGTEQQADHMIAKNNEGDPNGFNSVFTTPTSAFNSDGFFGTATPGDFVPYMNLKSIPKPPSIPISNFIKMPKKPTKAIVTTPETAVALL